MTYLVSGATFNYREVLKDMGGEWNATDKTWRLPASADRDKLNRMVGCVVRNETRDTERELIERLSAASGVDTKFAAPQRTGTTDCFGDDMEYFNYFAVKNPRAFFGFSNLETCLNYIEAIPASVQNDARRNHGWQIGSDRLKFTGTQSMPDAIRLARDGWKDGVDTAAEVVELLSTDHATARKRRYDVAGGRVNVGRMLSGNPLHMQRKTKQPGRKVIRIFVETAMLANVKAEDAAIRAACIAAVVDILEAQQFSCEIFSIGITNRGLAPDGLYQTVVRLKNAGEKLNLNDLVFCLGHPSFNRRFRFAMCATSERCRDHWGSYGASGKVAFNEETPLGPNEFYFPRYAEEIQGRTIAEKARFLLPKIIDGAFGLSIA